jgi:hypothetical protein
MGHIELNDSVSRRRVRVAELTDIIRIDVTGDRPHVVVPEDTVIERLPSEDSGGSDGGQL